MALSGFLVPALTGALIERQRIADSYDEKAGKIIDAVAPKYNEQLDKNQKEIALHKANYDAVVRVLGIPIAEAASKGGFLTNVDTAKVVNHVQTSLKDFIEWVGDKDIETIKKEHPDAYQSLFSDNYAQAKSSLKEKRDFAAKNFNKGAIKNVSDLYLSGDEEPTEPTKVESAQKFLFGDRVTDETGSAYEQAVAEKLGDPITIKSDNAAFSLLREYYSEIGAQGKTFENMDEMLFHGYQQIMKWNARTGDNFFALESERQNEVGTMILPKIGSPQLYKDIENKWLNDPIMQKLTTDLYTSSPVWMKVQEALVLAHNLGHRKGDNKTLPSEVINKVGEYKQRVTDYDSLLKISNSLDARFELVIKKAMDFSKDIAPGDPDKQAEIVGKLYTDLGFNDNLVVGDINPDNNSGILGTFITTKTAKNPEGVKMYIYRGTNGKYWGIPVDPEFRMQPPVPLLEEQVNKILNQ